MSIREQLENAAILWDRGRRHGAWVHVLIAAAATSRIRFPALGDAAAFKAFIRDVTPTIIDATNGPIAGGVNVIFNANGAKPMRLDAVLYKHLRCNLLHEAVISTDLTLSASRVVNGKLVADLKGGSPLTIPDFWVVNLAKAVAEAPENAVACTGIVTELHGEGEP